MKFRSELFSVLLVSRTRRVRLGGDQRPCSRVGPTKMCRRQLRRPDVEDRHGSRGRRTDRQAAVHHAGRDRCGDSTAGFRIGILWFFGFTLLATLLLGRTKFGSWIFAVGGNKQAARQVGVPAARTKTQLFMIVSVAAWLVGCCWPSGSNTVQSVAGNGLEFEYIIAAVVGGTLLTGGYGSAFGAPSAPSSWRCRNRASRRPMELRLALRLPRSDPAGAVIANNFIKTKAEASR